jgi:hypothetical protein
MPTPARGTTLQDAVAVFGTLLVIPALVLRIASRDGRPELVSVGWILHGLALLAIAVGFLIGAVKREKPSPGMWGVLVVWAVTAVCAL